MKRMSGKLPSLSALGRVTPTSSSRVLRLNVLVITKKGEELAILNALCDYDVQSLSAVSYQCS